MPNATHNSRKRSSFSDRGKPNPSASYRPVQSAVSGRSVQSGAPHRPVQGGAPIRQSNAISGAKSTDKPRRNGRRDAVRPDRIETAAGGVVYRRRNGSVEVFFIKDSFGRWTFPKGHQELGETLAETAIREIREETGLTGLRYLAPLGKKVLRFRREVGMIHKSVHYFLFEAPADAKEHFATRAEVGEDKELIQEGRWVPMRQAFSVSSYKNSDHLLANAFRLIGGSAQQRSQQANPALQPRRPDVQQYRRRRWKPGGGTAQPPRGPKPSQGPVTPRVTF